MTDANQQAQELARTMAQLNEEMALYGRSTRQTQDAVTDATMKAKYGINNFTASTTQAANALTSLGSALIAGAKAMAEGKKGAAAMNDALGELAQAATAAGAALALMIPGGIIVKAFVAALTMGTVAMIKFNQMTLEMVDKLHKGYQGMYKAGAAASDGMSGLFEDAKKLGLSMGELDSFVQLVAENSKDFALFAGSVGDGRKRFADLGKELDSSRIGFFNLGMTTQEINSSMAGFIKLQSRVGQTQNKTTQELAESTKRYMLEQDALTKLTGLSRKEQEDAREEIRAQERFAAKLEELRSQRKFGEAKELEDTYLMIRSQNKKAAQGFADLSVGMLGTEAAIQEYRVSNGKSLEASDQLSAGLIKSAGAAQMIGRAHGETADAMRSSAMLGQYDALYGNFAGDLALKAMTMGDGLEKARLKIDEDQKRQAAGLDPLTAKMSAFVESQIKANEVMERGMLANADRAISMSKSMQDASMAAANSLMQFVERIMEAIEALGAFLKKLNPNQSAAATGVQVAAAGAGAVKGGTLGFEAGSALTLATGGTGALAIPILTALGALLGGGLGYFGSGAAMDAVGARAAGGPVSKSTPYLVGENGPEIFVPKDAGNIVPNDRLGAGAAIGGNFSTAIDEMYKDVKTQEKTLDVDTIRQKQFSDLQKRYFDTYGGFMKDVIEQVEDNDPKDSSSSIGRMFSGMFGGGSGTGIQMPKASNIMGMGGGQGLQATSQSDLARMGLNIKAGDVQAGGAGISPKLIEMAKAIQAGVPGFNYFSAFNDRFHQENASSSKHTQGLAADFTTAQAPSAQDGKQITNWLKQMGASLAIDEYNNPSSKATAGHFHVEIPAFADGGNVPAGQLGIAGENGKPELITGPASVTPNNDIMGAFNAMNGLLAQSVVKLDDLLRAQKDNNDISNKMLRMQQ
jgi:Skp family chaperone for outer membrane proteins